MFRRYLPWGPACGGRSRRSCGGGNDLALVIPFQVRLRVATCFAACKAWGIVGGGRGFTAVGGVWEGVAVGVSGCVFFGVAKAWDAPFGLLLLGIGGRHGRSS